ncbi:MAG: hypothetical protein U5K76_12710 [Woeseiaceae bacterium]|nr:hypothetical protein [Woeseiaceae bacterium]
MSDRTALNRPRSGAGITVSEISPMDRAIAVMRNTTPAFIGRALRGPLNTPVLIESFTAFTRRFGGAWHRSTLGPAVDQFFAHGGQRLYVVRAANDARGAVLRLPAGSANNTLGLRALEPGSSERLRAAVDYDGIVDDRHFNLVVQRLSPESHVVIDQEIHARVSCDHRSPTWIGEALQGSSLVELIEPLPPVRPDATMGRYADATRGYVLPAERGTDGRDLCDYDLIGSAADNTGLFALDAIDDLDLVYLPPPALDRDPGPAAILAAELYCRKRGAMLIMDPPASWSGAAAAAAALRHSGLTSANVLSYFPRLRRREDAAVEPAGGAIAGLLCKLDRADGPWGNLATRRYAFGWRLSPAVTVNDDERALLERAGLNAIAVGDDGRHCLYGGVTLGRGSQADPQFARLHLRRLCLAMGKAIESATRWAVFEQDRTAAATRVQAQVHEYMTALATAGAFDPDRISVQCDAERNARGPKGERALCLLLAFHPHGCDEQVSLTLYQTASGCRMASTAFAPVNEACA